MFCSEDRAAVLKRHIDYLHEQNRRLQRDKKDLHVKLRAKHAKPVMELVQTL
jgi:hypothetical protein